MSSLLPLDEWPDALTETYTRRLPKEECRSVTEAEPWLKFLSWRLATGDLLDDGIDPLPTYVDLGALTQ